MFVGMLFFSFQGIAQEHVFDQYIRNSKVGTLSVFIEENPSKKEKTVRIESKVNVSMLFLRAKVEYEGKVIYRDGRLITADIQICRDGSTYQEAETHWKGRYYLAVIDGNEKRINKEMIQFSSLLLYAKEPRNIREVYAEIDGIFNRLEHLGRGRYELHLSGSRNNYYTYRNGKLVEAKLDHWLAPIQLKRQD
ncbi:MAG: hypothetical protein EA362_04735 [Saprospirales bacterium]|nr:MAG: hypothetical protein EA362_04735 [Saprospirales bacterium]